MKMSATSIPSIARDEVKVYGIPLNLTDQEPFEMLAVAHNMSTAQLGNWVISRFLKDELSKYDKAVSAPAKGKAPAREPARTPPKPVFPAPRKGYRVHSDGIHQRRNKSWYVRCGNQTFNVADETAGKAFFDYIRNANEENGNGSLQVTLALYKKHQASADA